KTIFQSFEAGHDRAYVTILDSNLTTLIAAFALYYFGTGPIRGFAVTLTIGIIMTMFAVLVCGKIILRAILQSGSVSDFKMMQFLPKTNIAFVKYGRPCMFVSLILMAAGVFLFFQGGEKIVGIDFKGGSALTVNFLDPQKIDGVRSTVKDIPGAVLLPVTQMTKEGFGNVGVKESSTFQIRTTNPKVDDVRNELKKLFPGKLSPGPFADLPGSEIPPELRAYTDGGGLFFNVRKKEGFDQEKMIAAIKKQLKDQGLVAGDPVKPEETMALVEKKEEIGATILRYKLLVTKADKGHLQDIKESLKKNSDVPLAPDPFLGAAAIGPAVVSELTASTVKAMLLSWFLMIIYIAFRFSSWKFGLAAVIALVHDAIISIGAIALFALAAPESWGLSFEFNLSTVAAILTIIGFSVNDTIVIFDRIRENLIGMRKETFPQIIDISLNQTLSRTFITSFTVWLSVIILYFFTMGSGVGIESFAFPLIIGLIAGTYSTIYIASPILIEWYRNTKPVIAK
ncbi:MAG: protein-export membrane protein SecF, partial [Planctomycetes bacterium RBG_16_59_8]